MERPRERARSVHLASLLDLNESETPQSRLPEGAGCPQWSRRSCASAPRIDDAVTTLGTPAAVLLRLRNSTIARSVRQNLTHASAPSESTASRYRFAVRCAAAFPLACREFMRPGAQGCPPVDGPHHHRRSRSGTQPRIPGSIRHQPLPRPLCRVAIARQSGGPREP